MNFSPSPYIPRPLDAEDRRLLALVQECINHQRVAAVLLANPRRCILYPAFMELDIALKAIGLKYKDAIIAYRANRKRGKDAGK